MTPEPSRPRLALRDRWPDLLVAAAIAAVLLQAWWTRYAFNPDGISYLDLAGRLRAGDLPSFVQGYWSPAFPLLIAAASVGTGGAPATMLLLAHALGALAVIAAILLLRAWGRRLGRPRFTVAALLALLLVTDGFPKFETVTPDLLLLGGLVWLAYELLARDGARWRVIGLLLGLIFLIKTSAWPWLLLAVPLRLWAAKDGPARMQVLWSGGLTALIAALWIVPLSVRSGGFTVGSAARLNYSWYLLASAESRTPDTHSGRHASYREAPLDSATGITWAEYPDADRWTYAPWSDPTAWDRGIISKVVNPDPFGSAGSFWRYQLRSVFRHWLLPLSLVVLLPWGLLEWVPAFRRRRWPVGRSTIVAGALGALGIAQFVLVHVEPRLIAPYALLVGLAILHGPPPVAEEDDRVVSVLWPLLAAGGLIVAAMTTNTGLRAGRAIDSQQQGILRSIAATETALAAAGVPQSRIVVAGPAIPVLGTAYLSGARIVAQVLPRSLPALHALPAESQDALLVRLFRGRSRVVWSTTTDGTITVLVLPPAPTSSGTP